MLNILIAYPYLKKDIAELLKQNEHRVRFLLDSGAFTAWKTGKQITVDEYCRFIETLPIKPWRYFNLDVIGDGAASFQNYEIMRSRGFTPVPIFTRGESVDVLEEYYKTSDVVGIGGLVGTKGNKGFVKGIMRHVGSRKVHWLGFNAAEFLPVYRPYMCDSSSWSRGYRFGLFDLYDRNGRWIKSSKKKFDARPSEDVLRLVAEHGVDPLRLAKNDEWRNLRRGERVSAILTLSSRSWVRFQKDIFDRLGVNYFLACSADGDLDLMLEAHAFWQSKGAA